MKIQTLAIASTVLWSSIHVHAVQNIETKVRSYPEVCADLIAQIPISGNSCSLSAQGPGRMVFRIQGTFLNSDPNSPFELENNTLAFVVTNDNIEDIQVLQIIDEHSEANTAISEDYPLESAVPFAVDQEKVYYYVTNYAVHGDGSGVLRVASTDYGSGQSVVKVDGLDSRVHRLAANRGRDLSTGTMAIRNGQRAVYNQDSRDYEGAAATEGTSSIFNANNKVVARFGEDERDQYVIDFKATPNGQRTFYALYDEYYNTPYNIHNQWVIDDQGNKWLVPTSFNDEEMNHPEDPAVRFGGIKLQRINKVWNDGRVELLVQVTKTLNDVSGPQPVLLNHSRKWAFLTMMPDGSRVVRPIDMPAVPTDLAANGYESSCLIISTGMTRIDDAKFGVVYCEFVNNQQSVSSTPFRHYVLDIDRGEISKPVDEFFDVSETPSGLNTIMLMGHLSQSNRAGEQLLTLNYLNYYGVNESAFVSIRLKN